MMISNPPVVKVSDPKGHISLLRRSVYPTEVRDENIEDVPTTEEELVTVNQVDSNHRSCQEAARRGVELIKVQNTSNMTDSNLVLVVILY